MSSYIAYQGKGFWARDTSVRLVALLLRRALLARGAADPEFISFLRTQGESVQSGRIQLGLDRFAGEREHANVFRLAVEDLLAELVTQRTLPVEYFKALDLPKGLIVLAPSESEPYLRMVVAILLLLDGVWPGDEYSELQL